MVIAVRISSAADTDEIRSTRVSVAGAAVSCCSILRKMQERRVQRVEIENENIRGTAFEIHTTSNVDYRLNTPQVQAFFSWVNATYGTSIPVSTC